jgi:diguanylate cyclase (GGDEF)-like protein
MPSREALCLTVSIGVSCCRAGDTVASLVGRADKALYLAKESGKNRAVSEKDLK